MTVTTGEADIVPEAEPTLRRSLRTRGGYRQGLFWVLAGSALLALGFLADDPITRWLTLKPASAWLPVANLFSKAGEGWVVALAGVSLSGWLFSKRRFEASWGVFLVALTGLLTGLGATLLRSLVGRTRPDASVPQGFYGIWHDSRWIIGRYEFGAFPSGHTATGVAVAITAWLLYRKFGLIAFAYAAAIGWSRIAMGCHHFSDVVTATVFATFVAQQLLTRLAPSLRLWSPVLQRSWRRSPPQAT